MISDESIERLKSAGAKNVLVQIPEGLKTRSMLISRELKSAGFVPVISAEPCFGGCDLADADAKRLHCDAILHIGHTDFGVKSSVPVVYDEWQHDFNPAPLLRKNLKKLQAFGSIGLLASAQYLGSLEKAGKFLRQNGKMAVTGNSPGLRPGQALGCNYSNASSIEKKVDCFLFIGSGAFHSGGLLDVVGKPVFFVNAETGEFSELAASDAAKAEVKRRLSIEKARGMKSFAVFVSTKPGQENMTAALAARKHLEAEGKDVILISAGTLSPDKITGMGIEVLVSTACPRMRQDRKLFGMLIIGPEEAMQI
jgi:2-(3-amino-3-carboxypropyl)histidine synthase